MRDSRIEKEEGFLGPNPRALQVGDVQRMVFWDSEDGPFWMTPAERLESRKDREVGEGNEVEKLSMS